MTQVNRTIRQGIMTGQDPPWMGDSKAEALREAVREAFRPLTLEQLNGAACAVCGATDRPLTPIGVDTTMHTELRRCDRCEDVPT